MKPDAKIVLLLFGVLMVIGAAFGHDSVHLSVEDKRRVVRSMLDSQKDIRRALLKIRQQIMGKMPPHEDGEDGDDDFEGDDNDIDGLEEEPYFREQQKKIREAREKLEACVREIASRLISMNELIEKIDDKIDEEIRNANSEVNYNLFYQPNNPKPPRPPTLRPTRPTFRPSFPTLGPAPVPLGGSHGRYQKNTLRASRSLDDTIPTGDTEQLSNPDIPSVVTYEGPIQKAVQFHMNQQQIEA
ncbi:uncharacterized protein LOC129725468 [Wyeomyia smithii]|uniref:uncharacterized protein LOC129725468 n=1 Tax=Wyeomyia smithii TaxID=174621 RepID=UPI002467BBC7|nr:uncharacterized protein LOC129725468 [Wyeomyia smithii]